MLEVKLFYGDSQAPTRGSEYAAGYDLYSYKDYSVKPKECILVDTGICVTVPSGTYGRIAPRSSVAKKKILVNAGVIDGDYCGIVFVMVHNLSDIDFEIKKGERIAQLISKSIHLRLKLSTI